MEVLVVGATGATGRLLVEQLIGRGAHVRAIVRDSQRLPATLLQHAGLSLLEANLLDLSDEALAQQVDGCTAVASCLGHNLSFKGLFGHPRRLVAEATRRLCAAIESCAPVSPVRFVLMNTAGNNNRDLDESLSLGEKLVVGAIRRVLPPHADNEDAADYLRARVGQHHPAVEWTVVRPDSLTNESQVTPYTVYASPTRSAIFNAGKTSRVNVGHFMADLITDDAVWAKWRGQMPVIYNAGHD